MHMNVYVICSLNLWVRYILVGYIFTIFMKNTFTKKNRIFNLSVFMSTFHQLEFNDISIRNAFSQKIINLNRYIYRDSKIRIVGVIMKIQNLTNSCLKPECSVPVVLVIFIYDNSNSMVDQLYQILDNDMNKPPNNACASFCHRSCLIIWTIHRQFMCQHLWKFEI